MPGVVRQLECDFNPGVERIYSLFLEVLFRGESDFVVSRLEWTIGVSRKKPRTAIGVGLSFAECFPDGFPLHQQLDINICSRFSVRGIEDVGRDSVHGTAAIGFQ